MRSEPSLSHFNGPFGPQGTLMRGDMAQSGAVADWHRLLETRFGEGSASDSRADAVIQKISRLVGYGALFTGYYVVGVLIFG